MSNLFAKVGGVIASIGLAIGGFFGYTPEPEVAYVPQAVYVSQEEESLGADTVLPIAGMTYYLAGTGISSSASSFTLTSFTITQNGKKITDSEMSETFYFTLEPGSRARQEIIACTTVVQNADGTATISGCTRGMSPVTPYTASSSLAFAHAGGSIAIISNPPQLYNQVAIKDNDETITGYWDFPTPVAGDNPATKDYVLSVVTGGSITSESIIVSGLAGETFATGSIIYLAPTDQRWYKADADLSNTYSDRQLGVAQGVGSSGVSVPNGILVYGIDETQVGLTAGGIVWLSSTAGATTTSTTTQALGVAIGTAEMMFSPSIVQSSVYNPTTFSATTTFATTTYPAPFSRSLPITRTYTATSTDAVTYTYTKPANLKWIEIFAVGGGAGGTGGCAGSGGGSSGSGGAGGGSGGSVVFKLLADAMLTTTTTITVGGHGTGSPNVGYGCTGQVAGSAGDNSSFGSYAIAYGGGPGNAAAIAGIATVNGISFTSVGQTGNAAGGNTSCHPNTGPGSNGATSLYGVGGTAGSGNGSIGGNASSTNYGSGGGGSGCPDDAQAAAYGGSGAPGVVIITEYF